MESRELGRSGVRVGAIGLGCMGMSEFYGPRDETESIVTIHRARSYLEENLGASDVSLTAGDLARIDQAAPRGAAHGNRYPELAMGLVNG